MGFPVNIFLRFRILVTFPAHLCLLDLRIPDYMKKHSRNCENPYCEAFVDNFFKRENHAI